jgi:hypothetical protein
MRLEVAEFHDMIKDTQDLIFLGGDLLPLIAEPEELIEVHEWMMSYGALPGLRLLCFCFHRDSNLCV